MSFDAERLTRLGRVTSLAAAPCGTWLAVQVQRLCKDDAKYVSDLWRVPLEGEVHRLTCGEHSDASPAFLGNGDLLFLSKRPAPGETEERSQVWCLPAGGGEARRVSDEPLGVEAFAAGGERIVLRACAYPGVAHEAQREHGKARKEHGPSALRYTEMGVRHWDHWLPTQAPRYVVLEGGDRRALTPEVDREYREGAFALSPGGSWLVTQCRRLDNDQVHSDTLQLWNLASGDCQVFGHLPRTDHSHPIVDDAGRVVAGRNTRRPRMLGPVDLYEYRPGGPQEGRRLCDWDVVPVSHCFAPDGAVIATADWRGNVPVFRVDSTGAKTLVSDGCHTSVRGLPDGSLVGIHHALCQPPEAFHLAASGTSGAGGDGSRRLLGNLSGMTRAECEAIAQVESFEAPGDEAHPIQSFLVRPRSEAPHRLLYWVHGGPIGQWSDGWHWRWNALIPASEGWAVALPNPRGSTGVDRAFIEGIWNGEWGAACYRDLMGVADVLCARDDIDEARTVAMGGSFGGYMVNWFGTQTQRFNAIVTHASLYDLRAFHGVTDAPGWFALELGGHPDDNPEPVLRYSPAEFVADWKTPTLIIHGEKDYRVPISEGLALFEVLQRRGVPSELLVFPDENHWIQKPRNIRAWYAAVREFIERYG